MRKGDGQMITKLFLRKQLKALNAVVDCMDPKALALPKSIIDLIPRPANYDYNSELFNRKTALLLILWQQLNHQLSTIFNTKPFEQTS
jgi:hypothetical protein